MDTQTMIAQAREMLTRAGVPVNADNLNRAALAMARGESDIANEPQRTAPRRAATTPARAAPRFAPQGEVTVSPLEAVAEAQLAMDPNRMEPIPEEADTVSGPYAEPMARGDALAATAPTMRRRGTINGANRIDEDNPEAGMFEDNQTRQAVDVDDPTGLALALGAPLAMAGGAAVMGGRAAQAAMAARTAAQRGGSARYNLREQARKGINRDREAVNDPRGNIPRR